MILVAATLAPWKCDGQEELNWLENAEAMIRDTEDDLHFFAALEVDARGLEPYKVLLERLKELPISTVWTFSIDDDSDEWESGNRLVRICTGRNLITEFAMRNIVDPLCTHILHIDSDISAAGDSITKLLEVDWPMVGGDVPAYCLHGPIVPQHPHATYPGTHDFSFPVQTHMNTAGFLLLRRDLFRALRWRYDLDAGMTDDPCYEADAKRLGWMTLVRKDVIGIHPPLASVEDRDVDRKIRRFV